MRPDVYNVYFEPGRDGRPVARQRGMKIMIPVEGLPAVPGHCLKVRVLRDTRPGERGGALLVEVLEDLTVAAEAQRKAVHDATLARLRAAIAGMGLVEPPAEELEAVLYEYANFGLYSDSIRALVARYNPGQTAIPPVPADVVSAVAAHDAVPYVAAPREPQAPQGWRWAGSALMREEILPLGRWNWALRVRAYIGPDGRRAVEMTDGVLRERIYRAGLSPDEMSYRYGSYVEFDASEPVPVTEAEKEAAKASIPWPAEDELASYWEARRAYEQAYAEYQTAWRQAQAEKARYEDIVQEWWFALPEGVKYLAGWNSLQDAINYIKRGVR